MKVDSATFEVVPTAPAAGPWVMSVSITGSGFEHRTAPLVAMVGDVPVRALRIDPDGTKASGLLTKVPAEGARLRIGYLNDRELQETGVEFHA
jgi:hypothetical protein